LKQKKVFVVFELEYLGKKKPATFEEVADRIKESI